MRSSYTTQWVPQDVVNRHAGAALLNTFFETPDQRPVVVYVPTEAYWELARVRQTRQILQAASLWRFFRLPPWGPDYRRAWELQCTLKDGRAEVTGLDGHLEQIIVTREVVRAALHTNGITLPQGNLSPGEKGVVTGQDRLTFANLKQKQITLALQLYMQFFGMAHTQKYTMPELRIAFHLTQSFLRQDMVEVDYSDHILRGLHRIQEGSRLSGKSKAKKNLPLALGAPLILTRIVYYALGAINHLPPPLQYDHTIVFYPRANILRSPVKTRERRQAQPQPTAQGANEESKEEVVEPLRKRMRGSVPMPVPPRARTPPASPHTTETEAQPMSPAQELGGQGDDQEDDGADGNQSDSSMSEATKLALDEMLASDEAQAQADQAAERAERRRAEERREEEELEAAKEASFAQAKLDRKCKREEEERQRQEDEQRAREIGASSSATPIVIDLEAQGTQATPVATTTFEAPPVTPTQAAASMATPMDTTPIQAAAVVPPTEEERQHREGKAPMTDADEQRQRGIPIRALPIAPRPRDPEPPRT